MLLRDTIVLPLKLRPPLRQGPGVDRGGGNGTRISRTAGVRTWRLFREGPYTIVGTQLERALVTDMMRAPWGVDRGIQTIVVPSEMLPRLAPPTVLPYTPIPKVH